MVRRKKSTSVTSDVNIDELVNEGKNVDVSKVNKIIEENKTVKEEKSTEVIEEDKGMTEDETIVEDHVGEESKPVEDEIVTDDTITLLPIVDDDIVSDDAITLIDNDDVIEEYGFSPESDKTENGEITDEDIDDIIAECNGEVENDTENEEVKKKKRSKEPWYVARAKRVSDYYNW